MKICIIFSTLILSSLSAPTANAIDEQEQLSLRFFGEAGSYFLDSFISSLLETMFQLLVHYSDRGLVLAKLKSFHDGANGTFDGVTSIVQELKEISYFWGNLKKFDKISAHIQSCIENQDEGKNVVCVSADEIEDLRKKIFEGFNLYKLKFEPILEYFHHSAESAKYKNEDDSQETEALQTIIDGTQQIRESVESLLLQVSKK